MFKSSYRVLYMLINNYFKNCYLGYYSMAEKGKSLSQFDGVSSEG